MPKFLPLFSVSFLSCIVLAGISVGSFGNSNKPTISWSPEQVVQDQFPGTAKVITAKFTSQKDLDNVEFWITPQLNKYAVVEPESIDKVEKNKEYLINIIISLPLDLKNKQFSEKDIWALLGNQADKDDKDFLKHWDKNKISGLLFVKADKTIPWFQFWKDKTKTIKIIQPKPLKISVNIKRPSVETIPVDEVSLPTLERIYEDSETGAVYVKDEILIGFKENTPETRIKEIVAGVNGVFLGSISDLDAYQIRISNITDTSQLEQIIQQLEVQPEVAIATHSWIDKAR